MKDNQLEKKQGEEMNHFEKLEKSWEESQKNFIVEQLLAGKDLQEIIKFLPGFKESFSEELDTIICSDERVLAREGKKIGLAGQLILASESEIEKFVAKYKGKVKKVTSHDNCGAATIKYDLLKKQGKLPKGINNGDQLGIEHSKKLAEMLDAKYQHIHQSEMTGELHDARAICFDGTGKFDPSQIKEMPSHYVCSGPGFSLGKDYCQDELKVLIGKVAFSDHAFGDKFTSKTPFYIFVSADNHEDSDKFIKWAKEAVSGFGDRVQVEGFLAPQI